MRNLKFILLLLISVSLATYSCKKDEDPIPDPDPTPTNQTCYYSKMDYGSYYLLAEYNASNQITKMTEYDSTGTPEDYYTSIVYANNKISAIESYESNFLSSKFQFYYGANATPDSLIMYSDNGAGLEREAAYALTFTGDKLTKAEMGYNIMGFPVVISKMEFAYTGNNLTTTTNYEFDVNTLSLKLSGTTSYEYDSKKNPNYNIGINYLVLLSGEFGSENNATKITEKDETGAILQDASNNISYIYSSNNYPTKSTSTNFDNSFTETILYTYNCK